MVAQLGVPCYWQHNDAFEPVLFDDRVGNLNLKCCPLTGEVMLVVDPDMQDDILETLQALLQEAKQK